MGSINRILRNPVIYTKTSLYACVLYSPWKKSPRIHPRSPCRPLNFKVVLVAIHGEVIGNLQYRKLRAESERQVDVRWNKGNPCSQECISKRGTVPRLSHFILITNYEEHISHADFQSKEWRLCKVRKAAQFTC